MINLLKKLRRFVLRKLNARPMGKLMKALEKRGIKEFNNALEVFAYTGAYHTLDYFNRVKALHAWEYEKSCEEPLKTNLPGAIVKIVDSYKEIENEKEKFDLVVIDNHQGIFGHDYCEHFEMLPKVFRVLDHSATVIMNILPNLDELEKRYGPSTKAHELRREQWYGIKNTRVLEDDFLKKFYTDYCNAKGYRVNFVLLVKRNPIVSYLVINLTKV